MFGKADIEKLLAHLRTEYRTLAEWEQLLRDAHLGIARSDANVSLGDIDPRVIELIERYKPGS